MWYYGHIIRSQWFNVTNCVGFGVLTAVVMKNTIFWDIMLCIVCWKSLHAGILLGLFDPEDGGTMCFWNDGWLSMNYMALHPRREHSSYYEQSHQKHVFTNKYLTKISPANTKSTAMWTEHCCQVLRMPASYFGGPWFKPPPGDLISCIRFFLNFPQSIMYMTGYYYKLGHSFTLSHPVQFTNHPIFPCHVTELLKAPLNKPYIQVQECVVTTLRVKLN
jgi:hypothetical protein